MLADLEHARHPASSPSRQRRPARCCSERPGPRRGLHARRRPLRRGSECRKSLHTPRSNRVKRPDHGGPLFYSQYTNTDTGLIYLRNRVYDPSTAQFLTVDPLVAATRAPYSYAGDNPLNNEDPTGLAWQGCVGGTVSLGFFSFGGEVCYVSTPGGSGIAATGSVTAGPGFGANVHAGGGASNACRPSEYGGPFAQAGGSAEGIVGGYGNAFTNAPVPGHGRTVVGATGGATAGFGVEGGAGGSETVVVPFGGESSGGSCSC
jgi:RHS repeat-associated protein